jgi:cell wall-associated NlpC family hydrolase
MTEAAQRAAVVAEAHSWLRTPYHHMGRVKGLRGGVDCAMLLAEVYERAGVMARVEVQHYPRDWHLHRRDERFLSYILPRAVEIAGPAQPGDVVTYQIGLGFAHAAIVIEPGWPAIIHSDMDARCVTLADGTRGRHAIERDGTPRPIRFFTLWAAL